MGEFILYSIGVFLIIILLLVIILLIAKKYLSPSGDVDIVINGDKKINVKMESFCPLPAVEKQVVGNAKCKC